MIVASSLSKWLFRVALLLLFLLGWFVQEQLVMSPDNTWLLHTANEMFNGKQYGVDIFETNPPLILWLYSPVILFQKLSSWDIRTIFIAYIYSLSMTSLVLVDVFLGKFLGKEDPLLSSVILLVLTGALLFTPLYAFGQRDVLWLILILPYLFAAVLALKGQPAKGWQAVLSGVMAGVGFSLKPYFLPLLCLVEGYIVWRRRSLFGWWRTETAIIPAIMVGYLLWIWHSQPGYFETILPLVSRYYFSTVFWPWELVLSHTLTIYPAMVCCFYLIFRKEDHYPLLGMILLLGTLGGILSFVLARTPWYYHGVPGMILGSLLLVYIILQMARNEYAKGGMSRASMPLAILALFLWPVLNGILEVELGKKEVAKNARIFEYLASQEGPFTIGCFSLMGTSECYLAADLRRGSFVSGFPFFWWYGGMEQAERDHVYSLQQIAKDRQFLMGVLVRELRDYKPHWLIVSLENPALPQNKRLRRHEIPWGKKILLDPGLKSAFEKYHYRTIFGNIQIYERMP